MTTLSQKHEDAIFNECSLKAISDTFTTECHLPHKSSFECISEVMDRSIKECQKHYHDPKSDMRQWREHMRLLDHVRK